MVIFNLGTGMLPDSYMVLGDCSLVTVSSEKVKRKDEGDAGGDARDQLNVRRLH
jgi:hypothetical protein